ncbi:DUF4238 domain-containing protein [Salinimicrobium sp. HB62]|uniref:DUF4238 domain-containing protein n=1 Tax=Salinimicrobium sp. HB62 TaxID=3077781 RepID=UPI002D78FBC8|nr:DUF4238 domain-containing protein [Salinimicrobium sp. HB62]
MRQHFVPKVYLKHFAKKSGNEYVVDVYDIKKRKFFSANTKNICAEKHLYTLSENSKISNDILFIEKEYANWIEPLYLKAYEILINNYVSHISKSQKETILIGVFQLYLRNPKHLRETLIYHTNKINQLYKIQKSENKKGLTYLNEDFGFREFTLDEIIGSVHSKMKNFFKEEHLVGTRAIVDFHRNAVLEISNIRDDSEFITSDNPLIAEDTLSNEINPLLRSKEFTVPINKKFLLRIFHDNSMNSDVIYRRKIPNGSVASLNHSILRDSSRFLIGDKKAIEDFLKLKNDFLDNTSLELKMDALKQILDLESASNGNDKAMQLIRHFVQLYEQKGTLTKQEEYFLFNSIKEFGRKAKRDKLL